MRPVNVLQRISLYYKGWQPLQIQYYHIEINPFSDFWRYAKARMDKRLY